MSLSIDWGTKIISVPKAYLSLVTGTTYEMDLDQFHLDLRALEAGEQGVLFDPTHEHDTTVTIGGVTLSRVVELINGYTITFEDGQYGVNMVGANSNLSEYINRNQVSIASANSAGLTVPGATAADVAMIKSMLGKNSVIEYEFTGSENDAATIYFYDTAANATTHDKVTGLIDTLTMSTVFVSNLPTVKKVIE